MNGFSLDLVAAYVSLFVHCSEHYALQQRDGSYWRVAAPLSLDLVAVHLAGRCILGIYLLDRESTCAFAVFDADGVDGLARLVMLAGELAGQEIPTVLEASRRGTSVGAPGGANTGMESTRLALAVCRGGGSRVLPKAGYPRAWRVGITDSDTTGHSSAKSRVVSLPASIAVGSVGAGGGNGSRVLCMGLPAGRAGGGASCGGECVLGCGDSTRT